MFPKSIHKSALGFCHEFFTTHIPKQIPTPDNSNSSPKSRFHDSILRFPPPSNALLPSVPSDTLPRTRCRARIKRGVPQHEALEVKSGNGGHGANSFRRPRFHGANGNYKSASLKMAVIVPRAPAPPRGPDLMPLDTAAKVDQRVADIFAPPVLAAASVQLLLNCRIFRLVIANVSLTANAARAAANEEGQRARSVTRQRARRASSASGMVGSRETKFQVPRGQAFTNNFIAFNANTVLLIPQFPSSFCGTTDSAS